MSNSLVEASIGPGATPNWPTASPGQLCSANTASQLKRSKRPSRIIRSAPAPPSSAGWKISTTVPSKLWDEERWRAAASSIAVWPSWPQACIRPSWVERCENELVSWIGSASISARNPIARVDRPDRIRPTTPVPASPRCTSMPHPVNVPATTSAVRCSSKRNSGCACRSRRIACSSGFDCARLWISCIGVAPGLRRRCYRAGRSRGSTSGRTRTGRPMPVGRSPRCNTTDAYMGLVDRKTQTMADVHLDSTRRSLKIRTGPLGVVEWQRADDWSVMNKELIRVLVIDDHAVVREGLKHVISRQMDMLVAGEASTRAEALKLLDEQRFDVVVCDVKLPDGQGWDVLRAVKSGPHPLPVLMLSAFTEEQYVAQALGHGDPAAHEALSEREFAVMRMIASGNSLVSIAQNLHISPKTVTTYRARVLEKLGLENNAALTRYVLEKGLLD